MKTNTIHSLSDLKQFGINVLTGESCALSRRYLCDVTQEGKNLVMKALGVNDISLAPDWNGHDAVGSILLERDTLETCGILALLDEPDIKEVWVESISGHMRGATQEDIELYKENATLTGSHPNWRIYRKFGIERRGDRNIHQMSGRTS